MEHTAEVTASRTGETAGAIAVRAAIYLVAALLFVLLWHAGPALPVLFAGLLFGVVLNRSAHAISQAANLHYGWALALTVTVLFAVVGGSVWLFAARLTAELGALGETIPRALKQLVERYEWAQSVAGSIPTLGDMAKNKTMWSGAGGLLSALMGALTGMYIIGFLGLYIAVTPTIYKKGFLALIPRAHRERAREVGGAVAQRLWGWLLARLASMAVVGVLTALALFTLDVPMAFSLALMAGLFSFIPNIGPVLSAVPAVLVAFTVSPMMAAYVGGVYLAVQTLESYAITPVLEYKSIYLPPALTLSTQVIFSLLAGFVGLLVASPLCATLIVLVQELYMDEQPGVSGPASS